MRVQLLCDQKWRDLPNLSAVKLHLERLGHRVLLSATKDADAMIKAFRPDCIVINHLFATSNQKLAAAVRECGASVVVLPTEGAMRPELLKLSHGEFADFSAMDLHLAWSQPAAQAIRERWKLEADKVPVTGCTRFDFYTPAYRSAITTREAFCEKYDLDPKRPIVTWATAYNFADVQKREDMFAKSLREFEDTGLATSYRRIGLGPIELFEVHAKERKANSAAFLSLVKARPDVQFILRPHPNEFRDYYRQMIVDHDLNSVRFCPQDYIWNVLNASDLHLHRHCTTAVEAWMWQKPTIEMALDAAPELSWPERERGSEVARSTDELLKFADRYLAKEPIDEDRRRYREDYIHEWFGAADGKRCAVAAQDIDRLLRRRGVRRHYWSSFATLPASPRQVVTATLRYAVGKRPNEPLLRHIPAKVIDPQDKQIRRTDVRQYRRLLRPAVSG